MMKNKGFTLMETIIYMAILAVVSILMVNGLIMMMQSFGKIKVLNTIGFSAEAVMERMSREIRYGYDVDGGVSVFDVHPGRLKLMTHDSGGDPATVDFYLDGGRLVISENSGTSYTLTSSSTDVTNLIFNLINTDSGTKAVKIELVLRGGEGEYQRSENFYNTIVLRRSY